MFGWSSLTAVFLEMGVFRGSSCDADLNKSCKQQDMLLNAVFTVASVSSYVSCLLTGFLLDLRGPRFISLLGFFLVSLSLALLAFVGVSAWLLFPSLCLMGLSTPMMLYSSFYTSSFFKKPGVVFGLFDGSFDCSSAVFLVLSTVFNAGVAPFMTIILVYAGVTVLPLTAFASFCIPTKKALDKWEAEKEEEGAEVQLKQKESETEEGDGIRRETHEEGQTPKMPACSILPRPSTRDSHTPLSPDRDQTKAPSASQRDAAEAGRSIMDRFAPQEMNSFVDTPADEGGEGEGGGSPPVLPPPSLREAPKGQLSLEEREEQASSRIMPCSRETPNEKGCTVPSERHDSSLVGEVTLSGEGEKEGVSSSSSSPSSSASSSPRPHPSFREQALSPLFLAYVSFMSFNLLKFTFYFGSVVSNLQSLAETPEEAKASNRIFSTVTALGGLLSPLVGVIIDRLGLPVALDLLLVVSCIHELASAIPNLAVQPVGFVGFAAFRAFLFTCNSTFMYTVFAGPNVGGLLGVSTLIASAFASLHFGLFALAVGPLARDFFLIHAVLLVCDLTLFAFPWFLRRHLRLQRLAAQRSRTDSKSEVVKKIRKNAREQSPATLREESNRGSNSQEERGASIV